MKAIIDRELCIGCELCSQDCPKVFQMGDDGIAMVIDEDPPIELYPDIEGCIELCPVGAISVSDE